MSPRRGWAADHGVVPLEVVILTPVVIGVLAVIIYSGRQQSAQLEVEAAAQATARSISLARDPHAAEPAARAEGEATLAASTVRCDSTEFAIRVDTDQVEVTVRCQVPMGDLTGVIPVGSQTIVATATDVLDVWREHP